MNRQLKAAILLLAINLAFKAAFVLLVSNPLTLTDDSYHHLTIAKSLYEGRGFQTDVIWPLNLRSDGFPQPYFYRQPIYPYLLVLSYKLFGAGIFSAQLVNILCESLTASLVLFIAYELTGSYAASLCAALLNSFSSYQLTLLPQTLTESSFTLFVALAFYAILKWDSWGRYALAAIVAAAYLTREQGLILIPAAGVYFAAKNGLKKAFKDTLTVAVIALLLVSPWLIRAFMLTGNPVYTVTSYGILLVKDDDRFFSGTEHPKSPPELFLERLNPGTLSDILHNSVILALSHILLLPNMLLAFVILIERKSLIIHFREHAAFYRMVLAYYLILVAAVSLMYGEIRYLYSIQPLIAVISGISLERFLRTKLNISNGRADKAFHALFLIVILASSAKLAVDFLSQSRPIDDIAATYWLKDHATKDDVVMAYFPYYVPYVLNAKSVEIPSSEKDLKPMIAHYNVTYVIDGLSKKWYNLTDKSYLQEIHTEGNWTVYKVNAKSI